MNISAKIIAINIAAEGLSSVVMSVSGTPSAQTLVLSMPIEQVAALVPLMNRRVTVAIEEDGSPVQE